MFTLLKKDAIRLLEVELKRLKEILVDVNAERLFGWGLNICSVCAEAASITDTINIASKKKCRACSLVSIRARCREIEDMRNDAVFDSDDDISETFDYFKRKFAEIIKEVEDELSRVKFDGLESYTIIAEI